MLFQKVKYTDQEILSSIKNGNSEHVLKFLYLTVRPKVQAWIRQNDGDAEEVQDIFQDAVIAFYKYIMENKFKEGNTVAGFIFSISKNLWINRAKQKSRLTGNVEKYANIPDEESGFPIHTIDQERTDKIQEILSQLGERCKELLTYSIFHTMSMEDISKRMGFGNADTAKTKNYKCKQRLIKLIKEHAHFKELLYS